MYGFHIDADGSYGICNRDNYVILDGNIDNLNIIKEFYPLKQRYISTKLHVIE